MKTLIVAATQAEIAPTLAHFKLQSHRFIEAKNFDVLITGVGMVATAFALGQHLNNQYNLVLNIGIAGSFDREIVLGTLLEVKTDTFSELGAEDHETFISLPELGFGENSFNSAAEPKLNLPQVNGITVNKVHGNQQSIETNRMLFKPEVESMEGAAVFYACHQLNISTKQVRAISNYVEPRNRENWQIGLAIKNLNNWLIGFLKNYEL